jgi:protein-glutamine gamma-glutamyltransferase
VQHVRTAVDPATTARGPAARLAQPVSRALLPQWAARLLGLAALGAVGALEWQRLIGGYSSGRALLWVPAGLVAAVLTLAAARVAPGWRRALALAGAVVLAVLAGYALSGADLFLLKPRHWDDLASGLTGGLQALGTVRLPYVSADPWPEIALQVLGAQLLVLAGLLTFWPRAETVAAPARDVVFDPRRDGALEPKLRRRARQALLAARTSSRSPLALPDRGYQVLALAVLLILVASPVVSLGGTRSLLLGLVLAALTVAFLWLERLPLRPGLGVAALVGLALAGALPLAAVADRGEPWFDYRSFAEGLGPDDPVRFSWSQTYGPINWPRDGNEVMRVTSDEPLYWKARDLDVFDGLAWTQRRTPTPPVVRGPNPWESDVPEGWHDVPDWTRTISVSIRRMRSTNVFGAGTIMSVQDASREVRPGLAAGTWDSVGALRRGDSYTLQVYTPQPDSVALSDASSGDHVRQPGELEVTMPFRAGKQAPRGVYVGRVIPPVHAAVVHFRGWDSQDSSFAAYPSADRSEYNVDHAIKRTVYARTWALAKRLRRKTYRPYDYVKAVDAYLHRPMFRYSERPAQPPKGVAALDYFLNVSHEGYCQHYAGAMALLLRMGGVPARVVTGFSPGGYSSRHKAWIVRDTDAHAWVEAWFDRYGWVTLDPTPDATPARSQIAALTSSLPQLPVSADRIQPDATVGDPRRPLGVRPEFRVDGSSQSSGDTEGGGVPWPLYAIAAVLLLLLAAWLLALRRGPRGGSPMDRAIAELERALRSVGRPVATGTTLRQLEHRLGSYSPEVGAYVRSLVAGRYAASPAPPSRAGRRALRRALGHGLGPAGRLRALWALPPRLQRDAARRGPRVFEADLTARIDRGP